MKRLLPLMIFALAIAISPAQAQMLKNIARGAINQAKNSAEDRASEEVNEEVDKGVNKFIDNLIGEDSTQNQNNTGERKPPENAAENSQANVNRFMQNLGISTADVKKKDIYKFTSQIVTVTESTDEDGIQQSPVEFIINANESNSDFMFEAKDNGNQTATIFDNENKCMLVLSEENGKKTGFATKFDPEAVAEGANAMYESGMIAAEMEELEEVEEEECEMAKTGRTKTISGYKCDEFRCETNSEIEVAWITKEISASKNKLFGQTPWGSDFSNSLLEGMIIQYETKSKLDKSSSVMTVKSIDSNKNSTFSTAGYQISSLSFSAK
ncbi:MAG TPA: DUF4412 domain-containing protein [Prolixibacteraceae bacterium]|nr:DUF4412 domain-containing protein [Prolixibacteraceae bacterium]